MAVPDSFAELIAQTWPDARQVHDLEMYLDEMWAKWGGAFPPERHAGHWVAAGGDIRRLVKKETAAARRPRRPRKPAAPNRIQMELPV